MSDSAFVRYAVKKGVPHDQAEKLGKSCVTVGALHFMLADYAASHPGTPPAHEIMAYHGMPINQENAQNLGNYAKAAKIDGGIITWNNLFETEIPISSEKSISGQEIIRNAEETPGAIITATIENKAHSYLLNKAREAENPRNQACTARVSDLGQLMAPGFNNSGSPRGLG